ncbi:DHA1 family bicyclomycin/chloramphenicol resistance-like MFS transporter [Leclercia adecarboxylata]|uniref:Bcr/CflA family multidrug efflux MFS transporter n=1 Tax=Leclercia TaxID=83654 RepID=UPI000CDC0FCA|nr:MULTISPECIES: Bcr/CflA family multidrug efflux MFS transporter [Leclercia]POW72606.1 Bcr/CflA family drug resistance efflux transporter [Leclercia sp. LSNIH4]AUY40742.1 Bcr/CflA family drug resistance efflux transporter [Leclercia sp. LSNIH3]MCE9982127.1 Bcr/CflA family multidrug efflux MFS transporter [Leclercia adecarboxylata]MDH0060863.1 Bcr/CflA family multidrug efflux MFS transporter [Leclercia adecarboxylata]MDH6162568.1 DHA1 family bicyclomycin/chloramphenicol resistance-like MFS tra
MTTRPHSSFSIVFILGLLAMLMPLSIDMYLPALPVIAEQFGVPAGSAQMTLSTYILGFALGQLLYGPMADSLGRKPVVLGGTLVFAGAAAACAMAQSIDHLIVMRFFHGLAAAAASVVINALMRDIYPKEEFSRMMSFVMLVTTVAPLVAPMVGGAVLVWFSWHAIFWLLALAALLASAMIFFFIKETLPAEHRQKFHIRTTLGNFASLFRHKRVLSYMLASGFSFAGMFSFLSAGPFVYIELNHVSPQHFGYYFALNVVFIFVLTMINSRFVRRVGALNMFRIGLWIQFVMAVWMVVTAFFDVGFWTLVIGIAAFVGCISIVSSNAMAVILDEFPHMAGTASSLAGTFRFGIGAIVGALLSLATFTTAWPMLWSIALCATCSILFCLYASRPRKAVK